MKIIVEKRENAFNQSFLNFPQCFLVFVRQIPPFKPYLVRYLINFSLVRYLKLFAVLSRVREKVYVNNRPQPLDCKARFKNLFADSEDQDQTAQNVQSDLGSTQSDKETNFTLKITF